MPLLFFKRSDLGVQLLFFFPILFLHHCGLHILGSKGTLNVIYLVNSCHKISFKFAKSYMNTSEKKNLKKLLKVFRKRALKECILFMKERFGSATPFLSKSLFFLTSLDPWKQKYFECKTPDIFLT